MINFASLFNQYRQQNSSGVNELLEQPNIKMGRLLEEDSFINEYKSNNPRVTQFMTYERYLEVIEFLTVVPGPDDKKRAYKYPLAACDLLTIDCPNAIEYFFLPEEPIYINQTVVEQVKVDVEVQIQDPDVELEPQGIASVANNEESSEGHLPVASPEKPENEGQEDEPTIQEPKEQPIRTELENEKDEIQVLGEEEKTETAIKSSQAGSSEIPKATKFRKIIKKQLRTVQKVVKKEVPPLINNLLDYFRGEVNYTLAGYVSKVLSHFFAKKPTELLKYLLTEQMRELVLNHAESRSVGDLLVKILAHESTLFLQERGAMFKSILQRMSAPSEVTIMSNLSASVCEIVQKVAANLKSNNKIPDLNSTFFSLDTVSTLISNVIDPEESVSVYNAPMLLTYLTTVPFVLPEDQAIIDNFTQLLSEFVEKSCLKLNVQASSHPKLGVGRVKIVEILRHILKEDILKAREIIASKDNFFPTLYNLLVEYDLNNLLHNEIMKILEVALLEKEGSSLNQSVLKEDRLLNLIVREAREDKKIKKGDSVYKSRKGYIAHIINLCIKLKELSQTNSTIKKLTENAQFEEIFQGLIEKELYNTKKTLAGYAMRKDIKHEILFQKDEIIAAHLTFFQKCPSPVFDQEPDHLASDHINIQHPDLLEELEKQLEQNMTVKTDEEKRAQSEEASAKGQEAVAEEVVVPAEVVSPATNQYWVVHLQYSVDDLLADL